MPLILYPEASARPAVITPHPTRPFAVVQCEQRSAAWFEARLGRVTGSVAGAVWDRTKKGERTAEWKKLQDKLLAERLTGVSMEDAFMSYDMQRGVDLEPVAKARLEDRLGVVIRSTGFLRRSDMPAGASLDGDIDDFAAVVEIKCPRTTTHLGYIEAKGLPDTYVGQCLHNLYISGAERLVFASFDDRLPKHLQLFVYDVAAKDLPVEEYGEQLRTFLFELGQRQAALDAGYAVEMAEEAAA